ncbi:MAG: hypothetical protein ACAH83_19250 [Alphaproteobacteria bacterium]
MVHPYNPKEPSTVPGSWVVSLKKGANFKVMLTEIEWLIGGDGREKDVTIEKTAEKAGLLYLKSDAAFAEKIRKLPSVGAVEQESRRYIMHKGAPKI